MLEAFDVFAALTAFTVIRAPFGAFRRIVGVCDPVVSTSLPFTNTWIFWPLGAVTTSRRPFGVRRTDLMCGACSAVTALLDWLFFLADGMGTDEAPANRTRLGDPPPGLLIMPGVAASMIP